MLDRYLDASVHNIDRDADALRISKQLSDSLGYGQRMTFACEDVNLDLPPSTSTIWKEFQIVFLAALVGMDTQTKLSILSSLSRKLSPGTLVIARSAQGMRSVLYPVSFSLPLVDIY